MTIEPADCRLAAKTGRFKLHGKEHPFEMNVKIIYSLSDFLIFF
jgi:hypothetical protein